MHRKRQVRIASTASIVFAIAAVALATAAQAVGGARPAGSAAAARTPADHEPLPPGPRCCHLWDISHATYIHGTYIPGKVNEPSRWENDQRARILQGNGAFVQFDFLQSSGRGEAKEGNGKGYWKVVGDRLEGTAYAWPRKGVGKRVRGSVQGFVRYSEGHTRTRYERDRRGLDRRVYDFYQTKPAVVEFTIRWADGAVGIYSGTIARSGRTSGTTFDLRRGPQYSTVWELESRPKCAM